jgi:glycosyltransferase involved in cell wall biosynthesis
LAFRKPLVLEHHGFQAICPNGQLFFEPISTPCPGHFMARQHRQCLRCNQELGWLGSLKLWAFTFPRRFLCRFADVNIAPTQWLNGLLQLPRSKTIHHGLNEVEEPQTNVNAGAVRFVFQGRLVSTKGAAVIIAAAARLKTNGCRFELKIIGDGPNRESLEALSRELEISDVVEFLGYLPPERVDRAVAGATAVLMPSLGGEVFGLVALENMLRGKLVVASRIGALEEVIGDSGFACDAGDVSAWADAMERIIHNPELGFELGAKAKERALHLFSENEMVRRHLDVYERIAAGAH